MSAWFQAAFGGGTRGQQVPTLLYCGGADAYGGIRVGMARPNQQNR